MITSPRDADAAPSALEMPAALYRLFDAAGTLLYVGVSVSPGARFAEHAGKASWGPQIARKTVAWYETRSLALDAEGEAIAAERPVHNVKGSRSPEGPWRTISVSLRESDLARVGAVRGEMTRSEWVRMVILAALNGCHG